ncbi:unnamed protein product [Leptosia nina]|uniref:ANKLE2 third alpha/beta domain-containing protein n=1 Tax=Leptosia nina TaxID=320188 RepID=A0AAV1J1I4_9NEOP
MSHLLEILVTSDSNNTLWTSSIWDPHTGTSLMSYRGGGTAEPKTLLFIGKDYVAAVERTKPILHVWAVNSQQTVQGMRFILPGKASAFAVSPDGAYCIAGIEEKIYLWQLSSGSLLTIITRHYQKINHLKFTPEGRFFVSSAEDGMVMIWSLAMVAANPEVELVTQSVAGQHDPLYIFSDHSLPVTDMCISKTGIHGRLCTVSSDRTCKIYDLSCGELLLNLVFDEPLASVTLDVLDLNIFVGTTGGNIHQVSLTNVPRNRDCLMNDLENVLIFSSHTKAVTCLSVSLNGEILVSGSNDEQVILWHIKSRQPLRTIRHKGPITNAFFTTNLDAIYKQEFSPNIILHSLERTLEKDNEELNEIEILVDKRINFWPQTDKDFNIDIVTKEIELENKNNTSTLEKELVNMRTINANLYKLCVDKALNTIPEVKGKPKRKIRSCSEMSKAVLIPECKKDIGGVKGELCISPNDKKDGAIGLFSRLLRLDALSKRNTPDSPTSVEPSTTYYGVYIPCEIKKGPDEEALHVYKTKSEALELVRRYKSARFKVFKNHQDAVSFALRGAESNDVPDGNGSTLKGEKPYPFKAPSPQDMVALRKAIEAGLTCTVRDRVWDNPRYLVSSGNTPAIIQEGSRYNALHVAAKALNAEICNLLLTTVGNPTFVHTLYGVDADPDDCKEFAAILVDRYLNTPDKAMNETPLHFAAKFGAEQVVDVLTSFPQCNRTAKNKYGEMAKDIICNRVSKSNPETIRRISCMLSERYYVPVVHAEDESSPPTIGKPFTPASPPELNRDPLSPRLEIRAFAGPMEAEDAESFRRKWKTPPRSLKPANFRLKDISKGLESVGRNLAEQMNVTWREYWPFLDTFTDLRSQEGLTLLENYLKRKHSSDYSIVDTNSQLESPKSPKSTQDALSPMSELCNALKSCSLSERPHWKRTDPVRQRLCRQPNARPINGDTVSPINHTVSQLLCIERTCQVFAKRIADALIFSLTAEAEVAGDSLKSEAKHLQHTIYTYMDDERFKSINFALIHSRLAQLVVFKLKQQSIDFDDISNLVEFLQKLRCPNDELFSSDDEKRPFTHRERLKLGKVVEGHVRCVASFISEELTENEGAMGPAVSEIECADIWDKAAKCRCEWKVDMFERNSKKNASFRKNRSYGSPKSENFIRRLTFDQYIGDGKLNTESEKPLNMNSPGGDNVQTLYTVDVAKCHVVNAEISDDDSDAPESDSENYFTAQESAESSDDEMFDASDRALVECFIYGEEPSKMDRLVFDAIAQCPISAEEFPNVSRWRNGVAWYSEQERESWQATSNFDGSIVSTISWSICTSPRTPRSGQVTPVCSTPNRETTPNTTPTQDERSVSLQVSNWLRVTGPNSPRSALSSKHVSHNVSFGF